MSYGPVPLIERILLIGFMAAGKSTVGRILAERLDWAFVDVDDAITEACGRPPAAVLREDGEATFRRVEAAIMEELLARSSVVIAAGGGWMTGEAGSGAAAMRALPAATRSVWLRLGAAEAVRRAGLDGTDRPMLGPSRGRLRRAVALLEGRTPVYAAADMVVDVEERTPDAVAETILRRLATEAGGR